MIQEVCIILASLSTAIELLHSLHLAHLDVSPEQVLVHISPHTGRVTSAALTDLAQVGHSLVKLVVVVSTVSA